MKFRSSLFVDVCRPAWRPAEAGWRRMRRAIPTSPSGSSSPCAGWHLGRARPVDRAEADRDVGPADPCRQPSRERAAISARRRPPTPDPDGYTLVLFDVGTITISPSIYSNLGYDAEKGFAPVTMVAVSPHALVVNPSVPVNSVEELIAYSKANPDTLNFASAGNGTAVHLAGESSRR